MPQANALLTRVFGCNNNVQYVYNCLLAFYIGMYASKSSNENTEGYNKAVAAYEKIAARQDALDARNAVLLEAGQVPDAKDMMTDFQKGLRRLHSVWNAHTKTEQVGAPRAAFFVLGYDGWIASRGTVRLGPNAALAYLQDEAMFDVMTVNGTKTPRLLDYVFRPEVLEELSWLEFVRDYDRCRMPSGETDRVMPFLDDHPDWPRIGVFKRTSFLYPQVSVKRLPDLDTIETFHAALDDRALYTKNALTLTVPFRTLQDFGMRDHDRDRPFTRGEWWSAWTGVRDTKVTAYGQRFLDIAQEYYTQVLCNKRRGDVDIPFQDELDMMAERDEAEIEALDDEALDTLLQTEFDERPELPVTMEFEVARPWQKHIPHELDPAAVDALCRDVRGIMKAKTKGLHPSPPVAKRVMDVRDVYNNVKDVGTFVTTVMTSVLATDVLDAIREVEVQGELAVPGPPKPFERLEAVRPSLATVIRHYKFDEKQAEVFTMMATVFLCRLCLLFVLKASQEEKVRKVMDPLLSHPEIDQMFHVLPDSGGTGKSHIIKAIQNLAYCWGASRSLVLCGTSGIAGCLIGGRTMHNALDIHASPKPSKPPSPEQRDLWKWVVLGICDEVSMMSGGWLQAMHHRGRQLFPDTTTGFFGRDWMFAGDFNQLGCVGTQVYTQVGEFGEGTDRECSQWSKDGCKLWEMYATSVSHLKRNHRHASADKLLQNVLHAMHTRTVTKEMMEEFNAAIACTPQRPMRADSLYVTPENKSKEHMLEAIYNADARNAPHPTPGQTWRIAASF
jgi:hypothetical protein